MIPDAQLFLSSHCPHCPAILAAAAELVKRGAFGRLEVVNLEVHPEAGDGVRSLPWLRLDPFTLTGARSAAELEIWVRRVAAPEGMAEACHDLLAQVREIVREGLELAEAACKV